MVEDCLIRSKKFHLPKKLPAGGGLNWDVVIVDATEIVVQRPKKQKKYGGKKKAYTFRVQAIIHYKTRQIFSLCTSHGDVHDLELLKRNQHLIPKESFVLADKSYQGIYDKSLIPIKAKRGCKLDPVLKQHNREINNRRRIEHVFGALKIFRIRSERY